MKPNEPEPIAKDDPRILEYLAAYADVFPGKPPPTLGALRRIIADAEKQPPAPKHRYVVPRRPA
jgi:hypothetical protein